jgi:hypothetical protein
LPIANCRSGDLSGDWVIGALRHSGLTQWRIATSGACQQPDPNDLNRQSNRAQLPDRQSPGESPDRQLAIGNGQAGA